MIRLPALLFCLLLAAPALAAETGFAADWARLRAAAGVRLDIFIWTMAVAALLLPVFVYLVRRD